MAITRLELQTSIYEILSKEPTAYGLLTPTKVNNMIQDCMDFIASKMMKTNAAWLIQIAYANITANTATVNLPTGLTVINFVKKLSGSNSTTYEPLPFFENNSGSTDTTAVSSAAGGAQFYRLVNNQIYLEPTPAETLTNGLMIEYVKFPTLLAADGTAIDGDFDNRCFTNYMKWRAASQLYALASESQPPWKQYEMEWYDICVALISKRIRMPSTIKSFTDY